MFVLGPDVERPSAGGDPSESTWEKRSQTFSDVQIYYIALLDIWSIAVWLSNLLISFCLVQIYSFNVEGEWLVDGEANGDVFAFAFNASHLSGGENLNCDNNSRRKGSFLKNTLKQIMHSNLIS